MSASTEKSILDGLALRRMALVTAESCTGGLIASRITRIAGSSRSYWGGMVVYDNTAKAALASVPMDLIERHGAVSLEVARALADGALARAQGASTHPDWERFLSVVTTGIAGPSGGSPEKPVGLCFIGIALTGEVTETHEIRLSSRLSREEIQNEFATRALQLALARLQKGV